MRGVAERTCVRGGRQARAPRIGVIIVNWRGAPDTVECLESLAAATPGAERVVVVENGSGDDSLEVLEGWAAQRSSTWATITAPEIPSATATPWLTLVASDTNHGFAGGNNLGLALLERDPSLSHFLLLNNDATVASDFFVELAQALATVPDAGLLSGTIYEFADRTQVWYAGGTARPLRSLAMHEREVPASSAPVPTQFVCGCTMLISRAAIAAVGRLAECYFPGYMEDVEYSLRVRASGLPVIYAPRVRAYHKINSSFGRAEESPFVSYTQQRHRALFVRRNLRGWLRAGAIAYLAITKPARAVTEALKGRPRIGWAIMRGTVAGLTANVDRAARPSASPTATSASPAPRRP